MGFGRFFDEKACYCTILSLTLQQKHVCHLYDYSVDLFISFGKEIFKITSMSSFYSIFILQILFWIGALASFAQISPLPPQRFSAFTTTLTFTHQSIDDGLSSNSVRALLQDKKGFMWIGTARGLNRYDGHRIIQVEDTRSLSIASMVEWGDSLLLGTSHGVYMYALRTDSLQSLGKGLQNVAKRGLHVADMKVDAKGRLWIATFGEGVVMVDLKKGTSVKVNTPGDGKSYGCVFIDYKGMVWVSSNWEQHNLIRYNERSGRFDAFSLLWEDADVDLLTSFGASATNPAGTALWADTNGWLWMGGWNGFLLRFDPESHHAVIEMNPSQTKMYHVHSLTLLQEGWFLMGSDKGMALVDLKTKSARLHNRNMPNADAISDNFVYPIMQDREGGTWIGTFYGGVNYTHPVSGNFSSYVHSPYGHSVPGNVISRFCEDAQHRLWIASDDGGLCFFNPADGTFTSVNLSPNGTSHNAHALQLDGNLLYVGTYAQGMDIVDVNTLKVVNVPRFVDGQGNYIDATSYAIYKDLQQRLWVGTFHSVGVFHPDTRTFSDVQKVGAPVMDIKQDRKNVLWVATDGNGLWACMPDGRWKHYQKFGHNAENVDELESVYTIYEDERGTLWVGLEKGLFRYDREKDTFEQVRLYKKRIGVYGLVSMDGKLWIASSSGIICYSQKKQEVERVYKRGENISSIDFIPSAIYCNEEGRVYLGTTNGFVTFQPKQMHRNEIQPQVVFTGLDIFNRPVPVGGDILPEDLPYLDELRLSYRENVFRIHFSAMSFWQPSDISYSYYLEGFDDEWIDAGNHRNVTYTNLVPGTYVLHVRATTNDGVRSKESTLRIVITPPFYWNTPAKIIYVLLILASVFFFVRYLLRKKEQKHVEEIKEIHVQKEHEIEEIYEQKNQEIEQINIQKEQEVHDARLRFMTISDKDQAFLDKMEEVLERNFSNPDLSVDFLASELGVSRSGLFAKIKNLADVTPNEMIQVIRLKHAASLLATGNYRVNEVCYMVGFSSPSYFAKCFQKQYGCTPAKYQ